MALAYHSKLDHVGSIANQMDGFCTLHIRMEDGSALREAECVRPATRLLNDFSRPNILTQVAQCGLYIQGGQV